MSELSFQRNLESSGGEKAAWILACARMTGKRMTDCFVLPLKDSQ